MVRGTGRHRASVHEPMGWSAKNGPPPSQPTRISVSVHAKNHAATPQRGLRLCGTGVPCRLVGRICVSWVRIRSILPSICGNSLCCLFRVGRLIGVVCDGAFVSGTSRCYNYIHSWNVVFYCPHLEREHCASNRWPYRS